MYLKFKPLSRWIAIMVLVAPYASTLSAATQEVQLKSGERLLGDILPESNEQTMHLRSQLLGTLQVPRSSIASIKALPVAKPAPQPAAATKPKPPVAPKPAPKPAVAAPPAPKPQPAPKPAVQATQEPKLKHLFKTVKDFKTPASWSGNLRIGMNLSTGDRLFSEHYARGQLSIQPKGSKNFFRFGGSYSYRKNEYANGSTRITSDKFDMSSLYRRSFSKGWFFQNSMGYRVDNVKGIDHEIKESIGGGYKFKLFKDQVEINIGSGLGLEEYRASKTTDLRNGQNTIVNIFQELTWKVSKRTTFSEKFNFFRNLKDEDLYDYNFSAAFRTRLTDVFGLELSYRKDFDSEVGGKKKDDSQWRSAFVVYF
jgi:hypothetical protein